MLRCPKCNRTYQDDMQKFCTHDGGRLVPDVDRPKTFDPNATVTTDASTLGYSSDQPTSKDLGATIAGSMPPVPAPPVPPAPDTSGFRPADTASTRFPETTRLDEAPPATYQTGPVSPPSSGDIPPASAPLLDEVTLYPPQSARLPAEAPPVATPSAPLPAPAKKSRMGLLLTIVGVLVLLALIAGGVGGYFFFKGTRGPRRGKPVAVEPDVNNNANSNGEIKNTPPPVEKPKIAEAPPNSVKFANESANLDGKLAAHYVDFYFYYPKTWQKSSKAGVPGAANFVEVERKLPPDFTQENVTVSWYDSKGTLAADLQGKLPALIKGRSANLAASLPEYQKVSEGKTTVNGIEGYEFRFKAVSRETDKGDIYIWGRVVFLPPGDEKSTKGVTLYMLTTSLAPELKGVDDIGVKGELPIILNSFTLGKS